MATNPNKQRIQREVEQTERLIKAQLTDLKDIARELITIVTRTNGMKKNVLSTNVQISKLEKFVKTINSEFHKTTEEIFTTARYTDNILQKQSKLKELLLQHLKVSKNIKNIGIETIQDLNEKEREYDIRKQGVGRRQQQRLTTEFNNLKKQFNAQQKHKAKLLAIEKQASMVSHDIMKEQEIAIRNAAKYNVLKNTANKLGGVFLEKMRDSDISRALGIGSYMRNLDDIEEVSAAIFLGILRKGYEYFNKYDTSAFNLRKSLGLLRGSFDGLQRNMKEITISIADFGAGFEDVQKTITSISNTFVSWLAMDKELVKDITLFSLQLGLASDESSAFLKSISSITRSTASANKYAIGFAMQMANAAGVPLSVLMKDVASASDDIRIFTGKSATTLIKMAAEARQLGTNLQNTALTSKKLLDFQSSIADEMEASILLGRDINFQRARELAYRKDLIGANKEILSIAKQLNFDSMDPFQAEAFAKASGKTLQELQDMLMADKQISELRSSRNPEIMKEVELYDKLKKMKEEETKFSGENALDQIRQQNNQTRLNQLQSQFNKLLMDLSGPVMDIVDPFLKLATQILPPVAKILAAVVGFMTGRGVLLFFGMIGRMSTIFGSFISSISFLGKFGGFLGGAFKILGRFLGPIGLLFTIGSAIVGVFSELKNKWAEITQLWSDGKFFSAILTGLQAVGVGIIKGILGPFKTAFDWISEKFCGHSPSEIGLGILKGIVSVGPLILQALLNPFTTGFGMISKIFKSTEGLPANIKLPETSVNVNQGNKSTSTNSSTDINLIVESNNRVAKKLDVLIDLLQAGNIGISIDGTKLNAALAKSQRERGAFGAI